MTYTLSAHYSCDRCRERVTVDRVQHGERKVDELPLRVPSPPEAWRYVATGYAGSLAQGLVCAACAKSLRDWWDAPKVKGLGERVRARNAAFTAAHGKTDE